MPRIMASRSLAFEILEHPKTGGGAAIFRETSGHAARLKRRKSSCGSFGHSSALSCDKLKGVCAVEMGIISTQDTHANWPTEAPSGGSQQQRNHADQGDVSVTAPG